MSEELWIDFFAHMANSVAMLAIGIIIGCRYAAAERGSEAKRP